MLDKHLKRRLNITFRIIVILVICGTIVHLFPKAGSFQYEFQKGSPWRYETLKAPFDFPIYKTETELAAEREKITEEQTPIFNLKTEVKEKQTTKFTRATEKYRNAYTAAAIDQIRNKLAALYNKGILQVPEELDPSNIKTIKIVNHNMGKDVDFTNVSTLKKAYSAMTQFIDNSNLPASVKEHILSLNISNFIHPNLEFDASKTHVQLLNQLKNISLTHGLVRNGEIIITKRELVTPEKVKLLNSLKLEYRHNAGSYASHLRIIGGQIILTLTALIIFSLYFYYSKKRIFLQQQRIYLPLRYVFSHRHAGKYRLLPKYQYAGLAGTVLCYHCQYFGRQPFGPLFAVGEQSSDFIFCPQQLYVSVHAAGSRYRLCFQPVPTAKERTTFSLYFPDISNLYGGIYLFYLSTGRGNQPVPCLRGALVVDQQSGVKPDLSGDIYL